MLKHIQGHVHKYVVCFGISELEGVDMELLWIGGFVNEAGVEGSESTGGISVLKSQKNSLCITNMKRREKAFQEVWN